MPSLLNHPKTWAKKSCRWRSGLAALIALAVLIIARSSLSQQSYTFDSNYGGGSGTITVSGSVIDSFSFTVDGLTFDLADADSSYAAAWDPTYHVLAGNNNDARFVIPPTTPGAASGTADFFGTVSPAQLINIYGVDAAGANFGDNIEGTWVGIPDTAATLFLLAFSLILLGIAARKIKPARAARKS